jgi:ubiquinone/menaquinone biosynthesis C-methylase UbiE
MTGRAAGTGPDRGHYSYAHYANRDVAEGFDALRFSGPVGRYLLEDQAALLLDALSPVADRPILDVGTGTGRAAVGLAVAGGRVVGLDASSQMLQVARTRASAAQIASRVTWAQADGHHLPLADASVDAAVCLRVLMHAIDWRACLAELCRVTRWRVVIDFPAAGSLAAIESRVRRVRQRRGASVEAYRVLAERDVTDALAAHGFRVVLVRRQFVLPIALHKKLGLFPVTRRLEALCAALGLLRRFGSPVTVVAER